MTGGIFHGDDDISQIAFKHGVERINSRSPQYQLVPLMFNVSRTDSFKVQTIGEKSLKVLIANLIKIKICLVCDLAAEGVDAIFGPSSIETTGIAASIANRLEIPHVIFHWKTKPLHWEKSVDHSMTLNLYPDADILAEAFANVLVDYSWKSYTIIYENKENLIRLKDILQVHDPQSQPITLRQLDENYGSLLKEINARGDVNIVLDISAEKIVPFLEAAQEVKMLGDYNNYFITNLDMHTLDLSSLNEISTNITCLRIVDPGSEELANALRSWRQKESIKMSEQQVPHEAGMVHDALQIYSRALQVLSPGGPRNRDMERNKQSCSDAKRSRSGGEDSHGFKLFNFMKLQDYEGVTGKVEFTNASRTQFRLEILELTKGEFKKIGYWDTTEKVKYDRGLEDDPEKQIIEKIEGKMFKIVVKFGTPFLMPVKPVEGVLLEGNARYHGYVVDLINHMQVNLKFKYELEVVPDSQYGSLDPGTKKWNGLVKHLLDRKADMAVADLTITYERKTAVDFTMPFMSLGIGILYTKPPKKETNLFSFLDPFTVEVWLYTGLAYISVSFIVFILSRINNDDWESSHPCNQEVEEVESIWNIMNCIWLAMGSIMGQGCDILPK